MQDWINAQMKAHRDVEFAASKQLSLGQLIDKLEATKDGADKSVVFDFEYAVPTDFDSYRGIYAELAIGFSFGEDVLLNDFIECAKACIGREFEGYKGGTFGMSQSTPVWVANYGNAGSTAVVGVHDDGWQTVILTAYQP